MNAHNELTKRGFIKHGFWKEGTNHKFDPNLTLAIRNKKYLLYAYVIDDEVMYIGKSHQAASGRMNQYALNKSNDFQGKHVNGLRASIKNNIDVDIYLYFPLVVVNGNIEVDGNPIPAITVIDDITKGILDGLEKKFIREFRLVNECQWNTQS